MWLCDYPDQVPITVPHLQKAALLVVLQVVFGGDTAAGALARAGLASLQLSANYASVDED
jgi:hypothetical protein